MTSTAKSGITADVSGLVEQTPADAADVLNPVIDLLDHIKSGAGAVSADDTHVKHLEDALVAGAGITKTVLNPGADEQIQLAVDMGTLGNLDGVIIGATTPAAGRFTSSALAASTELTIAAGVVTAVQSYHRIDTEGDAASDDLDTINGGGGMLNRLIVRAENAARTVTITTAGNIVTPDGNPIALDETYKMLELVWDAGLSKWVVIWDGGGGGLIPSQSANTVYAGPSAGGVATPAFRGLVKADIPWGAPGAIGATTPDAGTFTKLRMAGSELTISGNAITPTGTLHRLDTEGDATDDTLDTISGGVDGQMLVVTPEHAARAVSIRHAVGNIEIPNRATGFGTSNIDMVFGEYIVLMYNAADSTWQVIAQTPGKLGTLQADDVTAVKLRITNATATGAIASGAIAYIGGVQTVTAETGFADNLDTISGGGNGSIMMLGAASGHTITVTTAGNILTPEGSSVILDTANKRLLLIYSGSKWYVMWGGTQGIGASANTSLSNLTSPTAVNQNLIPSGSSALGSNSNPWSSIHGTTYALKSTSSPATPPTSTFYLYAKTGGLFIKDATGKEIGPLGAYDPRVEAVLQTTDATVTTLLSLPVGAASRLAIDGIVYATRDQFGTGLMCRFGALARRTAGGSALMNSSFVNVSSESAATVTIDVDGSNNLRVRVQGLAATTFDWKIKYHANV